MVRKNFHCLIMFDEVRKNFIHIKETATPGPLHPDEQVLKKNYSFTLSWDEVEEDGTEGTCKILLNTAAQLDDYISKYVNWCKDAEDARPLIKWMEDCLIQIKEIIPEN